MLRIQMICFTLLFMSFSFSQNSNKASVKFVIGNAELQKSQQNSWEKIGLNTSIYEGDRIKTSSNSRVEMDMPDGSVIKINDVRRLSCLFINFLNIPAKVSPWNSPLSSTIFGRLYLMLPGSLC